MPRTESSSRVAFRLPVCAWLAVLSAIPLSAQPPSPLPAGAPSDTPSGFAASIDVRVVNIEAVVTDKKGERVHGLAAADLRLLVDGIDVPIDYFAEVDGSAPPNGSSASAGPSGNGTAPPRGRSLLVFLDDSFALKTQRDMVLKNLGRQLDGLRGDDRVAFVSFDGNHIAVLSDWTDDKAAIAAIVAKAMARPAKGIEVVAWRRSLQEEVEFQQVIDTALGIGGRTPEIGREPGAGAPMLYGATDPPIDPARNERLYDRPAETFISGFGTEAIASRLSRIPLAVMAAMRAFAHAPGRKIMLLMAGGWPSGAIATPIANEANRLGFTLYPVDVPGVDATFVANDAGSQGPSGAAAASGAAWEVGAEYTLELMARATGGQASYNGNRLQALPRALADTSSYYWISFTPRWTGDDRGHRIEVVPRRLDLSVRARRSFADLSLATRTQVEARGVLFFGGDEAARQIVVERGPAAAGGLPLRGRRIPFRLTIPLAPFAAPHLGAQALDLVLAAQSLDSFGTRTNFPETPVRIALTDAGTTAGPALYTLTLRLKRRSQRLTFTLREPASGTVIWGETTVDP